MNLQQQITSKIENAEIISSTTYANGSSVTFKANNKTFTAVQDGNQYNAYRSNVAPNGDVQLLPNSKSGKSFRTVTNFVNARS